jgi:uncharacterized protein YjbI with pentapeptide repeats
MKVLILPKKIIIFVLFVSISQGAALTLSFADGEQPVNQMERREQLELVKLKQEIKKLELENKKLSDGRGTIVGIAPFLTAIVALLGVFITLWRHLSEQRRQRDLDRKNLETDRIRRFNEKFNAVVENLGSESQAIQASAAVSIQTFLKPEYSEFHDQVFLILLANLKVQHNEVIQQLLTAGFEKAIRVKSDVIAAQNEQIDEKDEKIVLDLSGCALDGANLMKINLGWANLRKASLQHANLKDACLIRVKGEGAKLQFLKGGGADLKKARLKGANLTRANFREADLKWVHFEEADLSHCKFERAFLQGAHLEKSVLMGAHFEQADLNNAFFKEAKLDITAISSIVKAYNWRKAHFDPDILEKIKETESSILANREVEAT